MVVNEAVPSPQQVLTNFFGLLPVNPGQLVQPLRTSGRVCIGTFDAQPRATVEVQSSEGFEDPQVQIVQTTPSDFARLRFVSTVLSVGDPDAPHPRRPVPMPFQDIAVGGGFDDVMNLFHQRAGNVMTLTPTGNVGVGVMEPAARLHVAGTARVAVLEITGADVAEPFAVADTAEPGDVMVIDEDHPGRLKVSHAMYDRKVAGIASGAGGLAPGVVLGATDDAIGGVRVALSGRAWCKADARSNPIAPGDLLTTADSLGHAMKAVDEQAARGAILGKAMSRLDAGQGLVLALVNLQQKGVDMVALPPLDALIFKGTHNSYDPRRRVPPWDQVNDYGVWAVELDYMIPAPDLRRAHDRGLPQPIWGTDPPAVVIGHDGPGNAADGAGAVFGGPHFLLRDYLAALAATEAFRFRPLLIFLDRKEFFVPGPQPLNQPLTFIRVQRFPG